ncbi:MAG: nuclease-related domain-containing protein [Pseudomonadaceae bacterium]
MARFSPVRSQCQLDTPGEQRFPERLETLLEDDYLYWTNVPAGPKARYPDFVVLHPRRGILVLEVKNWKLAAIQSGTHDKVTLHTSSELKPVANPISQALPCRCIRHGAERRSAAVP